MFYKDINEDDTLEEKIIKLPSGSDCIETNAPPPGTDSENVPSSESEIVIPSTVAIALRSKAPPVAFISGSSAFVR